jgi:hypothetical protein
VRVLLDENLPHVGQTDSFLTMDRRLEHQQNLSVLPYGVIRILAKSNRVQDLLPLVPEILAAIERSTAGRVEKVGA